MSQQQTALCAGYTELPWIAGLPCRAGPVPIRADMAAAGVEGAAAADGQSRCDARCDCQSKLDAAVLPGRAPPRHPRPLPASSPCLAEAHAGSLFRALLGMLHLRVEAHWCPRLRTPPLAAPCQHPCLLLAVCSRPGGAARDKRSPILASACSRRKKN